MIVFVALLFVSSMSAEELTMHTVNFSVSDGGKLMLIYDDQKTEVRDGFSQEFEENVSLRLDANPEEGYTLKSVLLNEEELNLNSDNLEFLVDSNISVKVLFEKEETDNENVESKNQGDITMPKARVQARYGGDAIYTALRGSDTNYYVEPNNGGADHEFQEGVLRVNGNLAYCIQPHIEFSSGWGNGWNFVGYLGASQDLCTRISLALAGARQYMDAAGIHDYVTDSGSPVLDYPTSPQTVDLAQYYICQIIVWRYMSNAIPGLTYNNCYLSQGVSYDTQMNVFSAADAYVNANYQYYVGHGTGYSWSESAQPLGVFWLEDISGYLNLKKVSTAPEVSNNNACYSLANAQFGVYRNAACTSKAGTLTTDANGNTNTIRLPRGTYYVREDVPPKGFAKQKEGQNPPVKTVVVNQGRTITVTFEDEPINDPFNILIEKKDLNVDYTPQGDASLAGAKFQLDYYDSTTVTKEQMKSGSVKPKDSYIFKVKEFPRSQGKKYYIDVSDPECFVSSPTGSDFYRVGGLITFPIGTISVREIEAGVGYHIDGSVIVDDTGKVESTDNFVYRRIQTGGVSSPIHVYQEPTNSNDVDRGSIAVAKRDLETGWNEPQGSAHLDGAIISVTNSSENPIFFEGKEYAVGEEVTRAETKWSDKHQAYTADVAGLPYGTYTLREEEAPEGYLREGVLEQVAEVRERDVEVPLTILERSIQDQVIRGGIRIKKRDAETGLAEAREDTSLYGAIFEITTNNEHPVMVEGKKYLKGQVVKQLTTNNEGFVQTAEDLLPYGKYTIREIYPPKGFLYEGTLSRDFEIKENGVIVDMSMEERSILNLPIRGDVELLKLAGQEDGSEEDHLKGLKGAQFTITSKRTGEVQLVIESDENGIATTAGKGNERGTLLYGTYIITETKTPDGFNPIKPFEIRIREEGVTVKFIYLEDELIQSPVQVVKVDASTGKTIPQKNTTFHLLDVDKELVTMMQRYPKPEEISEFKTDESGTFQFPSRLTWGTYYLEELQAPEGYVLGDLMKFKVESTSDWYKPLVVKYSNENAMGVVHVTKTDEFTGDPMDGVEFELRADGDVITPDGTLRYSDGELVDTLVTDEMGKADSKEIFIGKYTLQETKTLQGYVLNKDKVNVEIKYVDQNTPVYDVNLELTNKPTEFEVIKKDIDDINLKGVVFTLTNEVTGDTSEYTTDENGNININYLHEGTYSLVETSSLPGYLLDKNPIYFTVNKTGRIYQTDGDGTWVSEEPLEKLSVTLINDYTKVDISKTDITGDSEVVGATLRVLDSNNDIIEEWVSTEEVHRIDKLPMGTYTLHEEITPEGYVTANDIKFEVKETGKVQKVKMVDKQVSISKTNITGTSEIEGAHLEITQGENLIEEWVSSKEPHYVTGLKIGETYTLTETLAPEGYVKAESIEFTVDDNNENQHITMKDRQVLVSKFNTYEKDAKEQRKTVNKNQEFVKFKTGYASKDKKPCVGAKFQVLDPEGELIEEWVTGEDTHAVTGLEEGKTYTLKEIEAPEGYVLSAPVEFTVEGDKNLKLEVVDKQVVLSKQDIAGVELEGAKIEIRDKEDNIVDEWVSGDKPHNINGLVEGETYKFKEVSAPNGYLAVEDFEFTVESDGMDLKITVTDDNTRVQLSKVDATTDKELPGAKLTLKDSRGKEIETWTSSNKPHMIERLAPGKYFLREDLAPLGYKTASDVEFEVKATGEIQKVTMKDEPKPAVKKLVQTGEKGMLVIFSVLLLVMAGMLVYKSKARR